MMKSYKIRLSLLCLLLTLIHGGAVRRGVRAVRQGLRTPAVRTSNYPRMRIQNNTGRRIAKVCTVLAGAVFCGVTIATGGLALPAAAALGAGVATAVKLTHNAMDGVDTTIGDVAFAAATGTVAAVGADALGHGVAEGVSQAIRHLPADHLGGHIGHGAIDTVIETGIEGFHHLVHGGAHETAHGVAHAAANAAEAVVGGSFGAAAALGAAAATERIAAATEVITRSIRRANTTPLTMTTGEDLELVRIRRANSEALAN